MNLSCWSCSASLTGSGDFCRSCGQRVRWRSWIIERQLGVGGNGSAYLVFQGSQRAVLKIPGLATTPQGHQVECRNLYLAASLGVAPAPLETAPDGLLMEYFPSPTGMSVRERACLFLGAVNRLHNRELVHRDIKPENLVGWQLIDLGTMVDLVRDEDVPPVGTRGYAAPEAYRRQISPKLDAYACGWVLVEWLGGPEPDPNPALAGVPPGWVPPHDLAVNWNALLEGLLAPDPGKRTSVGLAFHALTGEWCTLADGTRIASDLVRVSQWKTILPDAPHRDTLGYATDLALADVQRYLDVTGSRLPRLTELLELGKGTRRQIGLRPPERMLQEGLISDLGARNCRRVLWQPTSDGMLWGGTPYAEQEHMPALASPNAMTGLRVVAQ